VLSFVCGCVFVQDQKRLFSSDPAPADDSDSPKLESEFQGPRTPVRFCERALFLLGRMSRIPPIDCSKWQTDRRVQPRAFSSSCSWGSSSYLRIRFVFVCSFAVFQPSPYVTYVNMYGTTCNCSRDHVLDLQICSCPHYCEPDLLCSNHRRSIASQAKDL